MAFLALEPGVLFDTVELFTMTPDQLMQKQPEMQDSPFRKGLNVKYFETSLFLILCSCKQMWLLCA